MIVAGCDVGSLAAKAVILQENQILSHAIARVNAQPAEAARSVIQTALDQRDLRREEIDFCIGTGYGKEQITFADRLQSEISCHAKGAHWLLPSARTVIDIGGQDAKAIRIDDDGQVIRYTYNDKCAAGTGRFLEIMAAALEIPLEALGQTGEDAIAPVTISNQCVIFAETEVISLINEGNPVSDIIAGLHHAMGNRIASLVMGIGVVDDVVMTGGVAKNSGVFSAIANGLATDLKAVQQIDPQINGAFGAALLAQQYAQTGRGDG